MDQARGQDLRGLKLLVAVLGVLVVGGTAVVIGVIMQRIYARPAAASMSMAPAPGADLPAALPAGAHVAGIAAAGGLVAIWVTGDGGDKVLLLNPQTGGVTVALMAGK